MLAYIDSGIIMRMVEGDARGHASLRERSASLGVKVTSTIAFAEGLVTPCKQNDQNLITAYEMTFASSTLRVVDVGSFVAGYAALVRARFNLKIPDAIHVATAIAEQCDLLLTTDSDLQRCHGYNGLTVEVVPRVSIQ